MSVPCSNSNNTKHWIVIWQLYCNNRTDSLEYSQPAVPPPPPPPPNKHTHTQIQWNYLLTSMHLKWVLISYWTLCFLKMCTDFSNVSLSMFLGGSYLQNTAPKMKLITSPINITDFCVLNKLWMYCFMALKNSMLLTLCWDQCPVLWLPWWQRTHNCQEQPCHGPSPGLQPSDTGYLVPLWQWSFKVIIETTNVSNTSGYFG